MRVREIRLHRNLLDNIEKCALSQWQKKTKTSSCVIEHGARLVDMPDTFPGCSIGKRLTSVTWVSRRLLTSSDSVGYWFSFEEKHPLRWPWLMHIRTHRTRSDESLLTNRCRYGPRGTYRKRNVSPKIHESFITSGDDARPREKCTCYLKSGFNRWPRWH